MLKKLRSSLLLKFTSLFFFALLTLYLTSYALMHKFLLEFAKKEELQTLLLTFNDVWILLAFIFTGLFFVIFLFLRHLIGNVTDEIDDINDYLEEINNKNYEAVLKIEHHLEFLKLAVLLKNIVKRLKSKTK